MEQVMGVEPTYQAWEACILPMNYTCERANPVLRTAGCDVYYNTAKRKNQEEICPIPYIFCPYTVCFCRQLFTAA